MPLTKCIEKKNALKMIDGYKFLYPSRLQAWHAHDTKHDMKSGMSFGVMWL